MGYGLLAHFKGLSFWARIIPAFVIKIFVLSIFEWLFYTGFTVLATKTRKQLSKLTIIVVIGWKRVSTVVLIHFNRMDLPPLIRRTSPFSILGVLGGTFFFIQILIEHSGDPDQAPHSVASDLGLHCLPMSHKSYARLICIS